MVLAASAYLAVLHVFDLSAVPTERRFGAGPEIAGRLKIYFEPLAVEAASDAVQIRVDVAPSPALRGRRPNTPNRDLTVVLTEGETVEERVFQADEPMAPVTIRSDLDGTIARYPLDRYRLMLRIQAYEGADAETRRPVAEQVTVWEGVAGYRIHTTQTSASAIGDLGLRFDIRRTDAYIFFALAAYVAMAVVAACGLAISFLVFLGRRKVEATLTSALAALIFALPAMRNALPGAPPLGVRADLAVFLWAEIAAVIGLALFVFSWARQQP